MALGGALGPVLVADDAAALCVAGVALGDIYLRFMWQAWRHLTFTLVLGCRRGTHGTGWRAWVTPRHFAWQAWHLVTSTFVSRGRRVTISHSPWFCVAGVALMALGGALGPVLILVADDAAALCVAGVALMALGGALGPVLVADDPVALCVAGVALGDIYDLCHIPSHTQLCHTPSFTPIFDTPSFTHNFVTHNLSHPSLTHHLSHTIFHTTPRHFAWQAWHSWHWVACLGPF